jgi:hypothetical protein
LLHGHVLADFGVTEGWLLVIAHTLAFCLGGLNTQTSASTLFAETNKTISVEQARMIDS